VIERSWKNVIWIVFGILVAAFCVHQATNNRARTVDVFVPEAKPVARPKGEIEGPTYWAWKGGLHEADGEWLKAEEAYALALSWDGQNLEYLIHQARARRHLGKVDNALIDIGMVLAREPRSETARIEQALCLSAKGQNRDGLDVLNAVLQKSPTNEEALRSRVELVEKASGVKAALAEVDRQLVSTNNKVELHETRFALLDKLGRGAESMSEAETLASMIKEGPRFHRYKAWLYLAKGQFDNAKGELNQAIRLDPKPAVCYFLRSVLVWRSGKDGDGRTMMIRLLQKYPNMKFCGIDSPILDGLRTEAFVQQLTYPANIR